MSVYPTRKHYFQLSWHKKKKQPKKPIKNPLQKKRPKVFFRVFRDFYLKLIFGLQNV